MTKVGRNELCPCGSGKKHKRCCAARQPRSSRMMLIVVTGVALLALFLVVTQFTTDREASGPRRVWDPQHGHYHDVP
jgi:uncharacterized protein YecA (UPF0149 family)